MQDPGCLDIIKAMGVIYHSTDESSELQRRISADLRAKQNELADKAEHQRLTGFDDDKPKEKPEPSSAKKWVISIVGMVILIVLLYIIASKI